MRGGFRLTGLADSFHHIFPVVAVLLLDSAGGERFGGPHFVLQGFIPAVTFGMDPQTMTGVFL